MGGAKSRQLNGSAAEMAALRDALRDVTAERDALRAWIGILHEGGIVPPLPPGLGHRESVDSIPHADPVVDGVPNVPEIQNAASRELAKAFAPLKAAVKALPEGQRYEREIECVCEGLAGTGLVKAVDAGAIELPEVDLLILTTAAIETFATVRKLKAVDGQDAVLQITVSGANQAVYWLGSLGALTVLVAKSTQGSGGSSGATLMVERALRYASPKAVAAVGIAFGTDPAVTAYGDVLLASAVFNYDWQRRDQSGGVHFRSAAPLVPEPDILGPFRNTAFDMTGKVAGKTRISRVHTSLMGSGNTLADDPVFVRELKAGVEAACPGSGPMLGGEMEGAGLCASAAGTGTRWILFKAISDYGGLDGAKSKAAQPYAMEAALALLESVSRSRDWIDRLPRPQLASLESMDFHDFLNEKRTYFYGRGWLFAAVEAWRSNPTESPICLVTGGPGVGKSAFMAEYVLAPEHNKAVVAHHVCRFNAKETVDPRRFVENLAKRLAVALGAKGVNLASVTLQDLATMLNDKSKDALEAMTKLIEALPEAITGDAPLLIVIDSLDEALTHDSPLNIVRLLSSVKDALPPWLRVLATTRPDQSILQRPEFRRLKAQKIEPSTEDNLADLRGFIDSRLADPELAKYIGTASSPTAVRDALVKASEGNFLWAVKVLNPATLASLVNPSTQTFDASSLSSLPTGLSGFYNSLLTRLFPSPEAYAAVEPLLGVVIVAPTPIPVSILTALFPASDVPSLLYLLSQAVETLPVDGIPSAQVYHKSFSDFLLTEGFFQENRPPRPIEPKSAHALIGSHGLKAWKSAANTQTDFPRYMTAHLVTHLVQGGHLEAAFGLVSSMDFSLAVFRSASTNGLIANADRVLSSDPPTAIGSATRTLRRVLLQRRHLISAVESEANFVFQLQAGLARSPGLESLTHPHPNQPVVSLVGSPPSPHLDQVLAGHKKWITAIGLMPHSGYLVSAAEEAPVVDSNATRPDPPTPPRPQISPAPKSNPRRSPNKTPRIGPAPGTKWTPAVRIWDSVSGLTMQTLIVPEGVYALAPVAQDTLLTGHHSGDIYLWDLPDSKLVSGFIGGHSNRVNALALLPGGTRFASGGSDKRLCLWNLEDSSAGPLWVSDPHTHTHFVTSLGVIPPFEDFGQRIVSGSIDGTMVVVSAGTGRPSGAPVTLSAGFRIQSVAISSAGDKIYGGGSYLAAFSSRSYSELWRIEAPHASSIFRLALIPASGDRPELLAAGQGIGSVTLFYDKAQVWEYSPGTHSGRVSGLLYDASSQRLTSAARDFSIRRWLLPVEDEFAVWAQERGGNQRPGATTGGHTEAIVALAAGPGTDHIFTGSEDRTIRIWGPTKDASGRQGYRLIRVLTDHSSHITALAWDSASRTLFSAGLDQTLRSWSPDGERLAVASVSGVVIKTISGLPPRPSVDPSVRSSPSKGRSGSDPNAGYPQALVGAANGYAALWAANGSSASLIFSGMASSMPVSGLAATLTTAIASQFTAGVYGFSLTSGNLIWSVRGVGHPVLTLQGLLVSSSRTGLSLLSPDTGKSISQSTSKSISKSTTVGLIGRVVIAPSSPSSSSSSSSSLSPTVIACLSYKTPNTFLSLVAMGPHASGFAVGPVVSLSKALVAPGPLRDLLLVAQGSSFDVLRIAD